MSYSIANLDCSCVTCVAGRKWLRRMSWKASLKQFFFFFCVQFVFYGLWAWNMRAVSQIWPVSLVSTDLAIAYINFKVIKKITETPDHGPAMWGYVSGGAIGSLISMYTSLWVFGK